MTLGYPHPDILLAQLTSRQVAEWIAFATMERVGEPVPPDPQEVEKAKAKAQRQKVEGGLRQLMNKQRG